MAVCADSDRRLKSLWHWQYSFFCAVLLLGILWSDDPGSGFKVWRRYAILLVFIPYLSLLNRGRLPWAIGGSLMGYSNVLFNVLFMGIYNQLFIVGQLGIPQTGMSQTGVSAAFGIGSILALYLASTSINKKVKLLLWFSAPLLLFLQFNQGARGVLLATLLALLLLIFMRYRIESIKKLLSIAVLTIIVVIAFAYNSLGIQQRLHQAKSDIELSQQGKY